MQPEGFAELRITALVSIGRHPSSGRSRRAEQDARAVEIGLKLAPQGLEVLHAGDPQNPSLRGYAGMGLRGLRVIRQADSDDAVPALSEYLSFETPDIILTGVRAENGESSGLLPYLLGEALGLPVVTRIADIICIDGDQVELLQALPRGQRRALRVRLPFVASVDPAAPPARQNAFAPAMRAELEVEERGIHLPDRARSQWSEAAARKRPKRLKLVKAKSAADRFRAATAKATGEGGRVLRNESAREKAQAIFDLLLDEGVVR